MATITERFGFTKPAGSDPASIVPLNSNTDLIEQYLGRTQDMIAPMYDDTATYDVGDIVTYESNLYKCITAISTAETFDPTKWEATTAVEEGSGGGGGSSVIPNPTGTPTDTLSTIGIDGTIYGIEGGGSISGEGVEIYSTEEYIVGKWIDGKKLYQKTYHLAQAITVEGGGSWTNTGIDISDVSILVDSKFSQDVAVWDAINGINDNGTLKATILASGSLTVDTITIRYTKTVETPAPAWGGSVTNNYAGFIDADNVIDSGTYTGTFTYTATEDCYVNVALINGSNSDARITIDGAVINYTWSANGITNYQTLPLKKGQTLVATSSAGNALDYTVYGITYASGGSETPATDASEVEYDNTTSGLTADNVQGAVDELKSNFSQLDGLTVYKNLTPQTSYADFDDGSTLPLISLTSNIDPIQDLHGYDYPWAGGAGKNKLQVTATTQTINGVTFTVNSDGTVNLSGTATETFVFPLISGTLSFSSDTIITGGYAEASASKVALRINGSNLVPSEGYTISANTNITEIAIRVNSGFNTNGVKLYPMIRLSTETDATFAPYSNICPISGHTEANVVVSPTEDAEDGTTYTVQFKDGSNPLTVYGGTLDVVSGELVVDRASVDLGTLSYSLSSEAHPRFRTSTTISGIKQPPSVSQKINGLCEAFEIVSATDTYYGTVGLSANTDGSLRIYAPSYTDATSFKQAMNGVQLVYELATPQTYQLTPTQVNSLLGQNYISSDTGNITNIKYIGILNLS